jgi:hypothetical protein
MNDCMVCHVQERHTCAFRCSQSGTSTNLRLRSWSTTALELDSQSDPEDGMADVEVAELGLESDSEALAFAEQVPLLQVLCDRCTSCTDAVVI